MGGILGGEGDDAERQAAVCSYAERRNKRESVPATSKKEAHGVPARGLRARLAAVWRPLASSLSPLASSPFRGYGTRLCLLHVSALFVFLTRPALGGGWEHWRLGTFRRTTRPMAQCACYVLGVARAGQIVIDDRGVLQLLEALAHRQAKLLLVQVAVDFIADFGELRRRPAWCSLRSGGG